MSCFNINLQQGAYNRNHLPYNKAISVLKNK